MADTKERIVELLAKNKSGTITTDEKEELISLMKVNSRFSEKQLRLMLYVSRDAYGKPDAQGRLIKV